MMGAALEVAATAAGYDTGYTNAWRALLDLRSEQARALDVYTAVLCVTFLSELGQRFNRAVPIPANVEDKRSLERILDHLLAAG